MSPLSEAWVTHVNRVAQQCFGAADLHGAALADAVAAVSHRYNKEREQLALGRARAADLIARLKWFALRDLPKVEVPLTELALGLAAPSDPVLRVLDLGAGVGTTTLGIARWAARMGVQRVDVQALDRDADALRVMNALTADLQALDATPLQVKTRVADLSRVPDDVEGPFALIVVGFVINELWPQLDGDARADHAEAWVRRLCQKLTPDGALVILEPALRESTRHLQRLRDRLALREQGPFVFAPCLHDQPCPLLSRERDWCHAQVPFELPTALSHVARAAGLRDHDLTFSYLTVRLQRGHLHANLVDAADAQGWQRVVSAPLRSKGKTELMLCGEAGLSRAMLLDRERSQDNAQFSALGRGAVVRLPVVDVSGRLRVTADDQVAPWLHW